MYLADGGGGGTTTPTPQFTGTQTLHVEPSAIPDALTAFTGAYDRVTRKMAWLKKSSKHFSSPKPPLRQLRSRSSVASSSSALGSDL